MASLGLCTKDSVCVNFGIDKRDSVVEVCGDVMKWVLPNETLQKETARRDSGRAYGEGYMGPNIITSSYRIVRIYV